MSEYWVSHKKYFCKYCEIYIADDAPSRQQHESGLRHKGNLERFVRNLYKTGEKKKKDAEEEKREMARIERAAHAAFSSDVGAGLAKGIPTPAASVSQPRKAPPKPSNRFANYSTAQSLGYTDPDAERLLAEAEQRRTEGLVGEWEVVNQPAPAQDIVTGAKRHSDEDDRSWKLKQKKLEAGLGDIYDPGIIPFKPKVKKDDPELSHQSSKPFLESTDNESQKSKWTSSAWQASDQDDKPEGATEARADTRNDVLSGVAIKEEGGNSDALATLPESTFLTDAGPPRDVAGKVKAEDTSLAPPSPGLFRKRKAPAGSGNREKRF